MLRATVGPGVQADTEGGMTSMTKLEAAAQQYAAAKRTYSKAYHLWYEAHPGEAHVQDVADLASWQAEVAAQCRAVNEAMHKLEDAAMEMFP